MVRDADHAPKVPIHWAGLEYSRGQYVRAVRSRELSKTYANLFAIRRILESTGRNYIDSVGSSLDCGTSHTPRLGHL